MKKYLSGMFPALLAIVLLLTGCGSPEAVPAAETPESDEIKQNEEENDMAVYGTDLRLALPGNYAVELTVSDKGRISHKQKYALTRCGEGIYMYIGDTGNEYIFEKLDSGKYIQYQKGKGEQGYTTPTIPDSLWDQIRAGNVSLDSVSCDESMISSQSSVFTGHFNAYETVSQQLRFEGEKILIGRACAKYTLRTGHFGGNTTNEYWIDLETGLCLKMIQRYKSFLGSTERTIECTSFTTENVTLPQH